MPLALSDKLSYFFTFYHYWLQKFIKETLTSYPSVATEALKIYLILIMNDVCLFYGMDVEQFACMECNARVVGLSLQIYAGSKFHLECLNGF